MAAAPDFTLGAVILGSQAGVRLAGGPWWAVLVLAVLGLAAACLRIVFPQDSPDRLSWWRGLWRRRRVIQDRAVWCAALPGRAAVPGRSTRRGGCP